MLGGALLAARCCNVLCQAGGAAAAIAAAWCLRGVCAQCAQCGSGSGWESSCEVTVYVCVCDAYDKWIYNCKLVRGTVWAGHDARYGVTYLKGCFVPAVSEPMTHGFEGSKVGAIPVEEGMPQKTA